MVLVYGAVPERCRCRIDRTCWLRAARLLARPAIGPLIWQRQRRPPRPPTSWPWAPGCLVAAGWLERLREAAADEAGMATASALGAASGVAAGTVDLRRGGSDAALRRSPPRAVRNRPRLAAPEGGCVYVRRAALELAGTAICLISAASARGACTAACSMFSPTTCSCWPERLRPAAANAKTDAGATVQRALGVARRALRRLSVLIDARALTGRCDGTRLHVAELIGAVARHGEVRVTALVSRGRMSETRRALEGLPASRCARPGPEARRGGGTAPTSCTGPIRSRRRLTSPCWAGSATGWSSPTRT